jgi:protein O-GlcNAc transferase
MRDAEAHETAYADFRRSVGIDPINRIALEGLVEAGLATGRGESAARVLRDASAAHPDRSAPWIAWSKLWAARGNVDQALEAAITAHTLEPGVPEAIEQLASVHADLGDAERLSPITALMHRLFPDRPATFYYIAAAEFLASRLDTALHAADRAVALNPAYAQAHNLRGAVQARLGRTADARNAFRTALALSPRDTAIYNNYGLLELGLGNRDAAVALFREALAIDPASSISKQGLVEARLASR